MLLVALIWALLGLYCLFLPRRFFLVGSRWQLRDGDRAEASDTYVMVTRVGGVIFLIAAAGFTLWNFTLQSQAETRESLSAAWGVSPYSDPPVRIVDDPEVDRVTDVEGSLGALSGARTGLRTWKTAVVGRDEVGTLGVTVKDGDLWLAAVAGSCKPGPLMVEETATSVTVAMTGVRTPFGSDGFIPCSSSRDYLRASLATIIIVRVPLDEPLGDRELLTVVPPEDGGLGLPVPPIPGISATPSPSP